MSDSLMYQAAKEKEYSMHWMPLRCLAYFFKCKFAIYHKNQSVEGQEFGIKIEGNPSMKYRVKLEILELSWDMRLILYLICYGVL